ncbi:hypothetical protein PMAYCL1PPCAC_26746, partial [Pristionchus mayeri]
SCRLLWCLPKGMDNLLVLAIGVVLVMIVNALSDPSNQEAMLAKWTTILQILGRIIQDVSIAGGAIIGYRMSRVRGVCPGALLGVFAGQMVMRLIGEEAYDIYLPVIITGVAYTLTRRQEMFGVALFGGWWYFFARA